MRDPHCPSPDCRRSPEPDCRRDPDCSSDPHRSPEPDCPPDAQSGGQPDAPSRPQRPCGPSLLDRAVRSLDECVSPAVRASAYVLQRAARDWAVSDVLTVTDLVGWRAPSSCWAVAVIASGRAHGVEAGSNPPGAASDAPVDTGDPAGYVGPGDPVRLAVAVARSGEVAGRLSAPGLSGRAVLRRQHEEQTTGSESLDDQKSVDRAPLALAAANHVPSGGRMLDTLRRNLGLPTPPPPEGTERLLAVLWLGAVLQAARTAGAPLGWPAVVELHPAAQLLHARGERWRRPELERIVEVTASTWTWEILRAAEARRGSIDALVPSGTARWMDAGMYARWVLSDLPAPETLWHQARGLVTSGARQRLERRLPPGAALARTTAPVDGLAGTATAPAVC